MFAFTRTPLGRMLNAVRDNPERVEFVGYDTQKVRYIAFIIAAFFAGISGGLAALNFEIVTAEVVGAARSGAYLLFTFLGGATFFFGPIIGAILMVLAFVLLSELTKAWLLYLGLIFLFMVMYAPGGIASLIMMNLRVAAFGKLQASCGCATWRWRVTALIVLLGAAGDDRDGLPPAAQRRAGPEAELPGRARSNAHGLNSWFGCAFVMLAGLRLVRADAAPLRARSGARSRRHREGNEAEGSAMSRAAADAAALCAVRAGKTCARVSARPRSSAAPTWRCSRASASPIIGPNGAGKSTLFNLISGRFAPSSGEMLLNGQRINGQRPFEINRMGLSRSFQITNIFPQLSRCSRTCAAACSGPGLQVHVLEVPGRPATTPTNAPRSCCT